MPAELVYRSGDYLKAADELIQDIVTTSEAMNKLDLNPTSPTQKKLVTVMLSQHISKTRELILKINSIMKAE